MFPFHTSHIYIMKHSSPKIHCCVLSLPDFHPCLYHSPLLYYVFRALSSNLTRTILVFIYVVLHTISYFFLPSIFPSKSILYPHFSLTLRLLMSYIYIYIYIYIYMERLFLMFLDHTQRRSTVGRTPLDD